MVKAVLLNLDAYLRRTCKQLLYELLQKANIITWRHYQHLFLGHRVADEVLLGEICEPAILPSELHYVVCDGGEAVIPCRKGNVGAESAPSSFAIGIKDLPKHVAGAVNAEVV